MADANYWIALVALLTGTFNLLSIVAFGKRFGDPGALSLLSPLVPLFIMAFVEFVRVSNGGVGLDPFTLALLQKVVVLCRLYLGFAWVYVCHTHYRLNGILDFRQMLTPYFAGLTGLNMLLYAAWALFQRPRLLQSVNGAILTVCLFYAAISAFLILRKRNILLPSSWIAIVIAGISVVVHPLASLADILGFSYPFLDAHVPVWEQILPVYIILVNVPLLVFVWRSLIVVRAPANLPEEMDLTDRERQILSLLLQGRSYKIISQELGIALATVKTHINRIYDKLGVRNRAELQAVLPKRQ
jgi:DNA-binding CsgD family transcriptional regulator